MELLTVIKKEFPSNGKRKLLTMINMIFRFMEKGIFKGRRGLGFQVKKSRRNQSHISRGKKYVF